MRLTIEKVLEGVADALREQISPHLDDTFAAEAARMATSLITIAGRAGGDAVAIRVEENARIRQLLGSGAGMVVDAEFAAELAEAAGSGDPGLRISQLDAETGRLRALLVRLHAELEGQDSQPAKLFAQEIWRALRDFEMARAPRG